MVAYTNAKHEDIILMVNFPTTSPYFVSARRNLISISILILVFTASGGSFKSILGVSIAREGVILIFIVIGLLYFFWRYCLFAKEQYYQFLNMCIERNKEKFKKDLTAELLFIVRKTMNTKKKSMDFEFRYKAPDSTALLLASEGSVKRGKIERDFDFTPNSVEIDCLTTGYCFPISDQVRGKIIKETKMLNGQVFTEYYLPYLLFLVAILSLIIFSIYPQSKPAIDPLLKCLAL